MKIIKLKIKKEKSTLNGRPTLWIINLKYIYRYRYRYMVSNQIYNEWNCILLLLRGGFTVYEVLTLFITNKYAIYCFWNPNFTKFPSCICLKIIIWLFKKNYTIYAQVFKNITKAKKKSI